MATPETKDATTTSKTTKTTTTSEVVDVTVHPLVLLSAADHYHRVARGTRKRVVGVLLGQVHKGRVDALNSFAVPFEEDSRNPAVFYLDHNFLENMLAMFRKVSAKERVVGFYSTGPTIRPNDLRIFDVVQRFTGVGAKTSAAGAGYQNREGGGADGDTPNASPSPPLTTPAVFCIIDVRPDRPDLPVTAYKVVEQVVNSNSGSETAVSAGGGSSSQGVDRSFAHVPAQMGALEAEEVGVEHLLRDINDPTISTVASLIAGKLSGLATLTEKLLECQDYLQSCLTKKKTPHPQIIANLQTIIALLPNLSQDQDLVRSMMVKTNDMLAAIYLASIIRSVIALHDLINNKIRYGEKEDENESDEKENESKDQKKEGEDKKKASDDKDAKEKKDDKKKETKQ